MTNKSSYELRAEAERLLIFGREGLRDNVYDDVISLINEIMYAAYFEGFDYGVSKAREG